MQSQDETLLKNIPKEYELMINSIQDETISKLYSKINFQYLKLSNISFGQQITDDYNDNVMFNDDAKILYSSINRNFSTIEIKNSSINATNKKNNYNVNKQDYYPNSTQQIVNVIICNEFKCTIIEGIRLNVIKKIIDELKKEKASIIDVNNSKVEIDTREEIKNFRFYFRNEINNNKFVNYTISPIIIYMIRRFFYPRDNFFDRSFFDFNPDNNKNILDSIFLHRSQEDFYKYINKIVNKIRESNKKPKEIQDFQENDFIILRQIYFKDNASFNLVMHIKSFHIFMMKKILYPDKETDEFDHEINFCKNYSHRCFTPFYGFVKNKQKIIAFIYKFMANSTLASYLKSNSERSNDIFILTTINRISQGLEYLQSNYLIHRDLKPSNILIDNDHIPYISDFDTIRSITNKNGDTEKMTVNIGSMIYASPEQHNGGIISYPTDIYSFGQIIYFLFNNMNSKLEISGQKEKNQLGNIIKLYEECVETNPKMRPEMSQIKSIIIDEISSFVYYEKCMLNGNVNILVIKQLIYENIFIMMDNPNNLDNYFTILFNFINLFEFYL